MTEGERVKLVRKAKKLTLEGFGKSFGMSRSSISDIENGRRSLTNQTRLSICREFNVREEWLRTGKEPMFAETDSAVLSQLSHEFKLDSLDRMIVESYLNLGPLQRKVVKGWLRDLVDSFLSDENYDEYREAYIKENPRAAAARGGHSEPIDELRDLYDNGGEEK